MVFLQGLSPRPPLSGRQFACAAMPVHGRGRMADFLHVEAVGLEPSGEPTDGRTPAQVKQKRSMCIVDQGPFRFREHRLEVIHSGGQPCPVDLIDINVAGQRFDQTLHQVNEVMILLGEIQHRACDASLHRWGGFATRLIEDLQSRIFDRVVAGRNHDSSSRALVEKHVMHQRCCARSDKGDLPSRNTECVLHGRDEGWVAGSVVPPDDHGRALAIERSGEGLSSKPCKRDREATLVEQGIDRFARSTETQVHFAADAVGPKQVHAITSTMPSCVKMHAVDGGVRVHG